MKYKKGQLEQMRMLKLQDGISAEQAWKYMKVLQASDDLYQEVVSSMGSFACTYTAEDIAQVLQIFWDTLGGLERHEQYAGPDFDLIYQVKDKGVRDYYKALLTLFCQSAEECPEKSLSALAREALQHARASDLETILESGQSFGFYWDDVDIHETALTIRPFDECLYGDFASLAEECMNVLMERSMSSYFRAVREQTLHRFETERHIALQYVRASSSHEDLPEIRLHCALDRLEKEIVYARSVEHSIIDKERMKAVNGEISISDFAKKYADYLGKSHYICEEDRIVPTDDLASDVSVVREIHKKIFDSHFCPTNTETAAYLFRRDVYVRAAIKKNRSWILNMLN